MDDKKTIVCINCGKRFSVDRDDYEKRKREALCNECSASMNESNSEETDMIREFGQAVGRFSRSVANAFRDLIDEKQSEKQKGEEENDRDNY